MKRDSGPPIPSNDQLRPGSIRFREDLDAARREDADKSPAELQREIADEEERLGQIAEQLGDRIERAAKPAREAFSLIDFAREHKLLVGLAALAALFSIGIAVSVGAALARGVRA